MESVEIRNSLTLGVKSTLWAPARRRPGALFLRLREGSQENQYSSCCDECADHILCLPIVFGAFAPSTIVTKAFAGISRNR